MSVVWLTRRRCEQPRYSTMGGLSRDGGSAWGQGALPLGREARPDPVRHCDRSAGGEGALLWHHHTADIDRSHIGYSPRKTLNNKQQQHLVKLRLGVLPINGSNFRRQFSLDQNKSCVLCNVIESEHHFIYDCPLYYDLRQKYLSSITHFYVDVLKTGCTYSVRKLSLYLFHALRRRMTLADTITNA